MTFEILETEDADVANTFDIFKETLDFSPLFWHLFPHNDTPKGREVAIQGLLEQKHESHSRFLKVIDRNNGEIAGHAIWLVFNGGDDGHLPDDFFELQGDIWDTQEIKEEAQYAMRGFLEFRKNAIKLAGGKMLVLDILGVAEKYQRRGIGRMLVQWGTNLADELGYGAVVESSTAALKLYQSEGFQRRYLVTIPWPDKWAPLKEVKFHWLTRPASRQRDNQPTTEVK